MAGFQARAVLESHAFKRDAVPEDVGGRFHPCPPRRALVLGTFMDGFSMMVTTIPVILPILKTQNVDLVWFGVIATILTETALISPPEGLNVYVSVIPFFVMMIVASVILMVFPQIALLLPTTMKGN
ncbi:MAG: TRAP transporter large permease subunit [Candidatus Rokubacteria bacterium]|nr:TRAP transporter large permease subunit [Candidatus Rokubacteria bacterium]